MAGWRVGFAVGNASVIEALNLYQDHMYVSLFKAVQDAAAAALLSDQACVQEQNERYEKGGMHGSARSAISAGMRMLRKDLFRLDACSRRLYI